MPIGPQENIENANWTLRRKNNLNHNWISSQEAVWILIKTQILAFEENAFENAF